MIPDFTQSSYPSQIKPSIKNAAACKLRNSSDRPKTSDMASKKWLRKNGSSILEGFSPGKYDVLCNRSRHAFNHVGNRRFRVIVENHAPAFAALRTKAERSLMIQSIVGIINDAQGKFVEKNKDGTWDEVGLVKRKEKVGHALRAAITAVKSKDKTRTIYDVLGVYPLVPSNSTGGSSTQTNKHVKNEDSSEDELFDSFPSFEETECNEEKDEETLLTRTDDAAFHVRSAGNKVPHMTPKKRDEDTQWNTMSLTDAVMSTIGVQVSGKRKQVAVVVCVTTSDAVIDSYDWTPTDAFVKGEKVDDDFEMFKVEEAVIPFQDLQNQLEDTVMGLDDFFSTNPVGAC